MNVTDAEFWADCPGVRRLGGRLGVTAGARAGPLDEHLGEVQRSCAASLRPFFSGNTDSVVPLVTIESDIRNAACVVHRGVFAPVVTLGLIRALSTAIRRHICQGNALLETFRRAPRDGPELWSGPEEAFLESVSAPETRYFWNCLGRVLEFVVFHEAAHHVRGHAEILGSDSLDAACLDEVLWLAEAQSDERRDLRHKLEVDADIWALRLCYALTQKNEPSVLDGEGRREFWRSEMGIQITGILCLFTTLEEQSRRFDVDYRGSHPPALHRAIILSRQITRYYRARGEMSEREADDIEASIWLDLESTTREMDLSPGVWTSPQRSRINLDDMNGRLAGFRALQDQLDQRLEDRIAAMDGQYRR